MATLLAALDAVLATARTYEVDGLPLFTPANSSRDDYRVYDTSSSEFCLIVEVGGDTLEGDQIDGYGEHGMYQERHQINVSVAIKVGTGATGVAAQIGQLHEHVEGVKDHLRANRELGGIARETIPVRTSPVIERIARRGEAPTHLLRAITLYVYCESEL